MNNLKSTWCLLMVLTFGYISNSQELTDKSCPTSSDCECIPSNKNYTKEDTNGILYTFRCPKAGGFTLKGHKTLKEVHIKCPFHVTDYTLLKQFNFNAVRALEIERCQLPEGSFKSVIQSTTAIEKFDFRNSFPYLEESLTKDHLAGFENVKVLALPYNGITKLPDDFLQGMRNLTSLDLSKNKITSLPDDFLKELVNLTSLNLAGNNITLSKQFFSHVKQLETLLLPIPDHKETDEGSIFKNLTKLKNFTLILEDPSLSKEDFMGLTNLENLEIYLHNHDRSNKNGLRLPDGLVSHLSKLQEFTFESKKNRFLLPNYFLSNLTNLKKVTLTGKLNNSIPENIFWNSSSIKEIGINDNYIPTLPQDLFRDQFHLEKLSLMFNQIEHIPDQVFKNLANLEELDLRLNNLQNLSSPGIFDGLSNLKSLDLGYNDLNHIDFRAFNPLIKLEINKLNDNELSTINGEGYSRFFQSNIMFIDLRSNKFEKLDGNFVKFINESTKLKELILYDNPWVCDCSTRELINIIQLKWEQVMFTYRGLHPRCASNDSSLSTISVSEICPSQVSRSSE